MCSPGHSLDHHVENDLRIPRLCNKTLSMIHIFNNGTNLENDG